MNKSEMNLEEKDVSQIRKAGIIVSAIFLSVLVFLAAGCTGGGSNVADVAPAPSAPAPGSDVSKDVPGDDIMVEPGSADIANTPETKPEKNKKDNKPDKSDNSDQVDVIAGQNDKMVAMVVEDSGRANPFQPYHEVKKEEKKSTFDLQKAKLQYDLVDPPNAAQINSDAEKVLTTKVSGVMYDTESPSAILNIEGSDYLVRSGDVINGYKILAISPSVVTVQLGANVYKAGVGELLATDGIQYNTISNLDKKFGGAKK